MTDVVTLNLAGLSAQSALARADALIKDRSVADLSRLLVVDDTALLSAHSDAYAQLLTPRWRIPHLMCLSAGQVADTARLILPYSVAKDQESVVLWVGDCLGIEWPLAVSGVAILRQEGGPDGAERLIELLRSPEIFDRVRQLTAALPNAIASPGILYADSGSVGPTDFTETLCEMIERLRGPAPHEDRPVAGSYPGLAVSAGAVSPVGERGELHQAQRRASEAIQAAGQCLDELGQLGSLAQPSRAVDDARAQLAAAGAALSELRHLSERVLRDIPADGRPSDSQRTRLLDAGLRLPEVTDEQVVDPVVGQWSGPAVHPVTAVTRLVGVDLRGGESLATVADRLLATERRLQPELVSPAAQVERCCPAMLTDRLISATPFPGPEPWLPLAGVVAAGLAGQAGLTGTVAATVLWAGLTTLLSQPVSFRRHARAVYLAISTSAAAAGGVAGVVIRAAVKPSLVAVAVYAALALATAIMAVSVSWRARTQAWVASIGLSESETASVMLSKLVETTAARLSSAQAVVVDALSRARLVLAGVGIRLRELAEDLDADDESRPGRQPGKLVSSQLSAVLTNYLIDLVLTVLADMPAAARPPGAYDYERAQSTADKLLVSWIEHAREHGPLTPPPFATPSGNGVPPTSQAWRDVVAVTLQADPAAAMWQLCLPGDLDLLDVGARVRSVPFAPAVYSSALASSAPADTEWTSGGQRAGLLRLVPVKVAAVDVSPLSTQDGHGPGDSQI